MRFCTDCGHPVEEGRKICPNCGARIMGAPDDDPMQRTQPVVTPPRPAPNEVAGRCPRCSTSIPRGARSCPVCGFSPAKREPEHTGGSKKMPVGAIIGIVSGGVLLVAAIVLAVVFLLLPEMNYSHAADLMNKGDYAAAADAFDALGDYRDSFYRFQECTYQQGCKLIDDNDPDTIKEAVELFMSIPSYSGSADKLKEAKYRYAKLHPDSADPDTYDYLSELKTADYLDAADLFDELYRWRVNVVWNSSSEDKTTDKTGFSKSEPVYLHATLSGGEPGAQTTLHFEFMLPNGSVQSPSSGAMYSGMIYDVGWPTSIYDNPANGKTGTLKVRICDDRNRELYSGSVKIN